MLLVFLLALPLIWIFGDFVYSRVVRYRLAQWESGIKRDESGVREGCQAYTLGDGSRAILMVHGINDSPYVYHKMAPRCVDAGYTVRVMRLPGFAQPIEEYARAGADDWMAAVKSEIESLRSDHDKVYLVAHSLGGAIAIRVVSQEPAIVDGLALIAPAVAVSNQRSPLLTTRQWHSVGNALLTFSDITESPFPNDAHDPAEQEYPMRTRFSPRSTIDETFRLIELNADAAPKMQLPLLMIVSPDDVIVDPKAAESFFEECAAPRKEIFLTKDAGHAIPVDYGWQDVTDEITTFFGQGQTVSE